MNIVRSLHIDPVIKQWFERTMVMGADVCFPIQNGDRASEQLTRLFL